MPPLPGEIYQGIPQGWVSATPPQSPRKDLYLDKIPQWRRLGSRDPGLDSRASMPRSSSAPMSASMPIAGANVGAVTDGRGALLNLRKQKFSRLDKVYADRGRLPHRLLDRIQQHDLEKLPKTVQHALHLRKQETFDDTVEVMKEAMSRDAKEDFRSFKAPYNKNRHQFVKGYDDDALRWKVVKAFSRNDQGLGEVHSLMQSSAAGWSKLGTDLDGVRLPTVKRCALNYIRNNMTSTDRGAFWGAVGPKQQPNELYRCVNFPLEKDRNRSTMARTFS